MSFAIAYKSMLELEGLYSNDARDTGGETFMGIARNKHPKWAGWALFDNWLDENSSDPPPAELLGQVEEFYYREFWLPCKCDVIAVHSPTIAGELFEASVNCGPGNGIKFLQRALNVLNSRGRIYPDLIEDGKMGSKTLEAVVKCLKKRPASLLYRCQNGEQYMYYKQWSQHEDFPGVFKRIFQEPAQ
jgi:typhoid toxin secretion A